MNKSIAFFHQPSACSRFFALYVLFFFLVIKQNDIQAQTYPVQVQPTVTFASTFLSDYRDPSNTNVRVYLSDLSKINYPVILTIKLSSDKLTLTTAVNKGLRLTLQGGEVYFLNDQDLAVLFDPTALSATSNTNTTSSNTLPEGIYSLSFEAIDATLYPGTVIAVSNARTDFTIFSVNRFDPPLLTSPANKQAFDLQLINQNVFFNWTPRHVVFSPKQQVKYHFKLIEVLPVDRNPYDAMNVTPSLPALIDEKDLDFPVFIYTPADLPLKEGSVYAWQVNAYEVDPISNVESPARFKNEGKTEVYTFSIKENCQPVTPIQPAIKVNKNLIALNWNFDPSHQLYEVAYRPLGSAVPWTLVTTAESTLNIDRSMVESGIDYEYTVRAKCLNWAEPAYGGKFSMDVPNCTAPYPLIVDNSASDKTTLIWQAVPTAINGYRIQYISPMGATDPFTSVETVDNTILQYSLAKAPAGYKIRIDALCDAEEALGNTYDVTADENGVVGPCPISSPLQFMAQRVKGDTAMLSWKGMTGHIGYSITYWHRDSSDVKRTIDVALDVVKPLLAQALARYVYDNQVYNYQITFQCNGKNTVTSVGMFRIDGSSSGPGSLDPTSGNCFPPAVLQAEARSTTSAMFEWSASDGADDYQLLISKKGAKNFVPFTTISRSALRTGLEDSQQYQYLVRCRCGGKYSIFSDTAVVDLAKGAYNGCDSVLAFLSDNQSKDNIRVSWLYVTNPAKQPSGYKLTIREESQAPGTEYVKTITDMPAFVASNLNATGDSLKYTFQTLNPGTNYILRIQALCGTSESIKSAPLKASTKPDPQAAGDCGRTTNCDKSGKTPITAEEMVKGKVFHCADLDVTVETATGANGKYSGTGYIVMPIVGLGDRVSMNVSFTDVSINAAPASCVYDGVINIDNINASPLTKDQRDKVATMTAQINSTISQVQSTLTDVQNGIDQAQAAAAQAQIALQQATDYFQGGGTVGNVVTGELGETSFPNEITGGSATVNGTTVTVNGTPVTVPSLPAILKDPSGDVFQVKSDGTLTQVGTDDPTLATVPAPDLADGSIVFNAKTGARFAFDAFDKGQFGGVLQIERKFELINGNYYVPAKLILPGELDGVEAKLSAGSTYLKENIKFANGKGMVYKHTLNGNNVFTINIAGGPASDGQYIYAWYINTDGTKKVIGKLLVPSYQPKQKKVVLIPVKKATISASEVEVGLNNAYNKLGISYTVTLDESFRNNTSWGTGDGVVQAAGSSLLSNDYIGQEKELIQAYVDSKGGEGSIDGATAYFFAVNEVSKLQDGLLGKMPATEQFGFLYTGGRGASSAMPRTVAHEVGHGDYHLEHTFNKIYLKNPNDSTVKGSTTNLMDYGSGNTFWKLQWDIIHDPGHVWGILKKDKDAQATHDIANTIFVDPAGNAFNLKLGSFSAEEISIVSAVKYGPVISFKVGTDLYSADLRNDKFYGYKKNYTSVLFDQILYDVLTNKIHFVTGFDNSVTKTSSKQVEAVYCYTATTPATEVGADGMDPTSNFYRISGTQNSIAKKPLNAIYPNLAAPADALLWPTIPNNTNCVKTGLTTTLYFDGNIITESQLVLAGKSVTLLTATKSSSNTDGLVKTLQELKDKYAGVKSEPGVLMSFYENGFMVSVDENGEQTAVVISDEELATRLKNIKDGNIDTDSEILFQTKNNAQGKPVITSNVGYNKNLQPSKPGFTFSDQDRTDIQGYQNDKINTYLSQNNVTDLKTTDPEKSTTDRFPDGQKTVIPACSYYSKFCKVVKETGQLVKDCQIPDRFYDPQADGYNGCIINTSPYFTGVGNGIIDEMKSIPDLVVLATDIVLDEEVRNSLVETFQNLTFDKIKDGIINSGKKTLSDMLSTTPTAWHTKGKTTVVVVTMIMGTGLFSKGDDLLKKSDGAIGDITNVNKQIDDLSQDVLAIGRKDIDDFMSTNPLDDLGNPIQKADLEDGLVEIPPATATSKFGKTENLSGQETTYNSSGRKGDGWDKELNNPKANWTYKVGNNSYKTDKFGRVTEVEASSLQKVPNPDDYRNSYQQSVKCKKSKSGIDGDDGGHLIGSQFGGPGEQINVVPMSSTINRSGGAWFQMESQWANAIQSGKSVTNVKIKINYSSSDLRPTSFSVTWLENGVTKSKLITNS